MDGSTDGVRELFHVGLCVADIERSLRFYREVVGMELRERHSRESARFDELSGNHRTKTSTAYLTHGSFTLQLIQYDRAGGTPLALQHNKIGCAHLCFYVEDVRREFERVSSLPWVTVTSSVVVLNDSMTSFYTVDPDGVPVELLELTGPPPF